MTRFLRAVNRAFSRNYHHVDVLSPPQLPRKGSAILVCNHVSGLDPLLIQSVCGRLIVWMMAKEYYDIGAMRWIFQAVDAIPVDRNGRDLAATPQALRALASGRVVGIFPEGQIETSRAILPFQTGVALMAARTQVPICPAYLDGTQRNKEMLPAILYPNKATLRFGPPLRLEPGDGERAKLQASTDKIRDAVRSLSIEPGTSR